MWSITVTLNKLYLVQLGLTCDMSQYHCCREVHPCTYPRWSKICQYRNLCNKIVHLIWVIDWIMLFSLLNWTLSSACVASIEWHIFIITYSNQQLGLWVLFIYCYKYNSNSPSSLPQSPHVNGASGAVTPLQCPLAHCSSLRSWQHWHGKTHDEANVAHRHAHAFTIYTLSKLRVCYFQPYQPHLLQRVWSSSLATHIQNQQTLSSEQSPSPPLKL